MPYEIRQGDCLELLKKIPDASIQCCVTSPPYWGLRDYKMEGQLGLEGQPDLYVKKMGDVFDQVRRVLAEDGTLWLNLGDSYAGSWGNFGGKNRSAGEQRIIRNGSRVSNKAYNGTSDWRPPTSGKLGSGIKNKDLVGIPWMVAFELRRRGWHLRSDIIWAKPNPMPESVMDRPTKAHEYLFLLTKSEKYYYDAKAIMEPVAPSQVGRVRDDIVGGKSHEERGQHSMEGRYSSGNKERKSNAGRPEEDSRNQMGNVPWEGETRNKRSVWNIATKPFAGAHFATFPEEIPLLCVKAGTKPGDAVLDPFNGAGTTGLVALNLGRNYLGLELNPAYIKISEKRIEERVGLLFSEKWNDKTAGA